MNIEGFPEITLAQACQILRRNLKREQPLAIGLLAEPGAGKTFVCEHVYPIILAEHLTASTGEQVTPDDICTIVYQVAAKDASESAGPFVPFKDELTGKYGFEDSMAPLLWSIEKHRRGDNPEGRPYQYFNVVLDEYADAEMDQQNVFAPLTNPSENRLGGDDVGEHVYITATGNRPEDNCGSMPLSSKSPNRMKWYNVINDLHGWHDDYAVPYNVNPLVAAWWLERGDDLRCRTVPEIPSPFATNRSVTMLAGDVDIIMDSTDFDGTFTQLDLTDFAASVGMKAARDFVEYSRTIGKYPRPSEIFSDPDGAFVPASLGFQLMAVNGCMSQIDDLSDADNLLTYITHCAPDLQIRLGTKLHNTLRDSKRIDTAVMNSAAWGQFIARFGDYMDI